MRDNIVGFYISFVRQRGEYENSFLMQEENQYTSICCSSSRFKKFVRVDTGRGVRIFGACDPFGLKVGIHLLRVMVEISCVCGRRL